jgi:hypothetical protein
LAKRRLRPSQAKKRSTTQRQAARKLHGLPWWGWVNDASEHADFTPQERIRVGETSHDLYDRALAAYARTHPSANVYRRQYLNDNARVAPDHGGT